MMHTLRWLLLCALFAAGALPAFAQADGKFALAAKFEPPTAKPGDRVTLVLTATVADGWHAYGTKEETNLPIALKEKNLQLAGLGLAGPPEIPPGDAHPGPLGDTFPLPRVFEVKQRLAVPATMAPGEVTVSGGLDYQICDESSCLMPSLAKFTATLKVTAGQDKPGHEAPPPPKLKFGEKLALNAHFQPAVARAGETVRLVLDVVVVDTHHAYGALETTNTPVKLLPEKLELGGLERAGEAVVPPGDKTDVAGMDSYPLPHRFEVTQPLRVPAGTAPGRVRVAGRMNYQVCDEATCDLETDIEFSAELTVEPGASRAAPPGDGKTPGNPPNGTPTAAGDGGGSSASPAGSAGAGANAGGADNPFGGSLWALILACIGGGLFALAMPCTYPMIPITFSFFTKQAERRGGKVLPLALTYGLGIVLMFTLVGALLSAVIIDVVNHWATNAVIGAVFLFFAAVLFGWINLEPPQFVQQAAAKASTTGGMLGVFFMGATLVITSFTCTAPIVGSLLANVAQFGTGRVALGMAIFGLTMAAPFVALALMPAKVKQMPRSGEWMETLKVSLGFVELAAALKFVSMVDFALGWQALPRELFLLLWTAIFGLWALYLFGILRKAGTPNEGVGAGRMASGMAVTLLATYFLFGALGNKLDSIMTGFIPNYSNSLISRADGKGKKALGEHTIVYEDSTRAMRVAKEEKKLLLYNFTGFS